MDAELAGEYGELCPGRYTQLPWRLPADPPITLSLSILDCPLDHHPLSPFAAILVPRGRLLDWVFSTRNGLLSLLFSASVSRLVVLSRSPRSAMNFMDTPVNADPEVSGQLLEAVAANAGNEDEQDKIIKREVAPVLGSLFPWRCFPEGPPADPFVSYEDGVGVRIIVERSYSPLVGNILVEDVELTSDENQNPSNMHRTKLRRRMRFQRMPNLIQTEIPIVIFKDGQAAFHIGLEAVSTGEELELRPDHAQLVHRYLPPIVAGLILASPRLEACEAAGNKARVLSIGVGGGALPVFLHRILGFHVLAIDSDEIVLGLARSHFGLEEDEHLQVQVKDGFDAVVSLAQQAIQNNLVAVELQNEWQQHTQDILGACCQSPSLSERPEHVDTRMDVIVVDVDGEDPGLGLVSPPPAFLLKTFLLAARIALQEGGMLAMNVIPRGTMDYKLAVNALREVYAGLYEIRLEENHAIFALTTKVGEIDPKCTFAVEMMQAIDEDLIYQIVEID